jgi:DNA-binding transcriptional LysR family regulator
LDWDAIRVFLAVALTGSVNKAAAELKLQPSSVSRRIDELEHRLEAKLFDRRRTGMILTDAGADLYDHAQSMQRHADDIERSVRARDRREEGLVTIAAPDGIGSLWIAPRVGEFVARNPRIQLSLDCRIGPTPPDADRRPDVSIVLDKTHAEIGDDASALATMHYVFMASPRYLETYGTPKSIAAAAGDHRALRQTGQVSQRETWGARANAVEALASFAFETNSSQALVASLQAGAGIAVAPTYLKTIAPELVVVGAEPAVPIKLWLVIHRESRQAARVARVAEWLKAMFDPRQNPWFRDEFVAPEEFAAALEKPEKAIRARRSRR